MNSSFNNVTSSIGRNKQAKSSTAAFVFTVVLIICTVSFNVFLCAVIALSKRLKTIPNYFIINLCVADILISVISMPVWALFQVHRSDFATSLVGKPFVEMWIFVDIMCGTASICSLVCISVDRWVAISHPLRYMELMTARRAVVFVLLSWVYAVVVASLRNVTWPSRQGFAIVVATFSFVFPVTVILVLYAKISTLARRQQRTLVIQRRSTNQERRMSHDFRAAMTISVVIGTITCCWLPFFAISILYAYYPNMGLLYANVAKWFAYCNAMLNPLVYAVLDKQTRAETLKILSCRRH